MTEPPIPTHELRPPGELPPVAPTDARRAGALCALLASWVAGCRSVDPGPDYDRAADEVLRATGASSVFRPDTQAADLEARVAELLEGGLECSEAVELGLLNSPALQASFHSVGMKSADRVQAGLLANPSLNAVLRFPSSGGSTGFEGSLFFGLLDLWQVDDREQVAARALEHGILQLAHEATRLAAEIRVTYVRAVTTRRLVELAEENRALAQDLAELAEARLEAAAATVLDADLAHLEWSATAVALRDAELDCGEAERRLRALLGLPADLDLDLGALPDPTLGSVPTAEDLERLALERRLDLRAADAALARAEAEFARQRGRVWSRADVGVGAEKDGGWSVGPGLRLELPLFDQNQAQIARALEDARRLEKIRTAIEIECVRDARSAAAGLRAALDTLALYRDEILVRAEETLVRARKSYQAGKTTILPVLEAQRQVVGARQNHVRRLERAAAALSDVERATGTPREVLFHGDPEGNQQP